MPDILSVRALSAYIRETLEFDELLSDVWVEGEVSNFSRSSAGHCYFTLKEADAQLSCVLFRGSAGRLACLPTDGEAILVHGRISFYQAGGRLQLYVDAVHPRGLGTLYLRFQELEARLKAEGLFAPELKRPLPPFPQRIGVVTSPTGAALRDVLNVLRRRYPLVEVVLSPTLVQGKDAAPRIVAALERLRGQPLDLIIVTRGGGSIEDLWPFNEEMVARAIRSSPVPVISGVGHETDFTITDFVADLRAPTPSAAAELAVPDQAELGQQLSWLRGQLKQGTGRLIVTGQRDLDEQRRLLDRLSPLLQIADRRQRVDDLAGQTIRNLHHRLEVIRERLRGTALRLEALDPHSTLRRGYAIVRRRPAGEVVVAPSQVQPGERLDIQVRDGSFEAEVR